MKTLVIATRNRHKVAEIRAVLGEQFRYRNLTHFAGTHDMVEDADSFAGNAIKKAAGLARWLAKHLAHPPREEWVVLADDSGLEVDALGGAPGVLSARFASLDPGQKGNATDPENNAKLLRLLEAVPLEQRTARFRCAIALVPVTARTERPGPRGKKIPVPKVAAIPVKGPEGVSQLIAELASGGVPVQLFEGSCEGRVLVAPRGEGGFGYDPLFEPAGHQASFAELGEETKNRISHRAQALGKLKEWLAKAGQR